jgi:hypothetical protein
MTAAGSSPPKKTWNVVSSPVLGVSVPPALDALLGGDEVVDALARRVDGEAMKDVRHGCSLGRLCLLVRRTSPRATDT